MAKRRKPATDEQIEYEIGEKIRMALQHYLEVMQEARQLRDEIDEAWKHYDWDHLAELKVITKVDATYMNLRGDY